MNPSVTPPAVTLPVASLASPSAPSAPDSEPGKVRKLAWTLFGDPPGNCTVPPSEPVRFGQKHWLAQHRWLEPVIGYAGLAVALVVYLLAFQILNRPAALVLLSVWALFTTGAIYGHTRRPCTVMRLPIHALIVVVAAIGLAGPLGIGH